MVERIEIARKLLYTPAFRAKFYDPNYTDIISNLFNSVPYITLQQFTYYVGIVRY